MAMSGEDVVLFQHSCSHNEESGALILTSSRFIWRRNDGGSSITLLWSGIVPKSDKYQPSKGMIRVQVANSSQFKIFTLQGEDSNKLLRKFELGKSFIKHKLYNEPCPVTLPPGGTKHSTLQLKQHIHNLHNAEAEDYRKEQLLDSDPNLRAWYEELIQQGICDKDTFWQSRSHDLRDSEIEHAAHLKGMVSSLLSDIDHGEFNSKGVKHIQMNSDSKEEIFLLYPSVRKDFLEKVPAHMTEDEFWAKYFQKQHAIHSNLRNTDTMQNMSAFAKLQQQQSKGLQAVSSNVYVSPFVSTDVDLTASFGDYHTVERLDPEDYKWHSSDFISDKYVNKSTLIIQQQERKQQEKEADTEQEQAQQSLIPKKSTRAVGYYRIPSKKRSYPLTQHEDDSNLLNNNTDSELIPLKLTTSAVVVGDAATTTALAGDTDKSAVLLTSLSQRVAADSLIFPSSNRALHFLHSDLEENDPNRSDTTATAMDIQRQSKIKSNVLDVSVDFEKFLKREFGRISELLRYFYASINKYEHSMKGECDSTERKNIKKTQNMEQIARIQEKLQEQITILLDKKKYLQISPDPSITGRMLQNSFRCIKETSDLIYRAFDVWERTLR